MVRHNKETAWSGLSNACTQQLLTTPNCELLITCADDELLRSERVLLPPYGRVRHCGFTMHWCAHLEWKDTNILWYSANVTKMQTPSSTLSSMLHGFLMVSEPYLKRAVFRYWQRLRAITLSFSTCAKFARQDNEVLASNDSLQHCSISYVKQAGPGYWL